MDSRKFLDIAKYAIVKYLKRYGENPTVDDVFVVWSCKTLQNNKALLATDVDADYYEVTYNGDRDELYLDVYEKIDNVRIMLSESDDPIRPSHASTVITGVVPKGGAAT